MPADPPPILPKELHDRLLGVPTSILSDCSDRLDGLIGLNPVGGSTRLLGTAFTVRTRPGDNLGLYAALSRLDRGHVLVVDGGGQSDRALAGELLMLYAKSRGCAGFVIDGAVRDLATFRQSGFPCFVRAACLRGPYKSGPFRLNVPVSVGGQVVNPGDVMVGDEDGVVSFSLADAPRLADAALARMAKEDRIRREIAGGAERQSWIDEILDEPSPPVDRLQPEQPKPRRP